jgi:hypothetical protein
MLALLLSSLLSVFLFLVFGTFVSKIAKLSASFTEKLLIGLVTANTIATILSLFFAMGLYALPALVICCIVLVIFIQIELKALISLLWNKRAIILFSSPFILVAFVIALNQPVNYDSGLYHLQTIKWIEAYPVVPGLANLHGRFGFNPNIFTLFALTSLNDVFKQEIFSVNFIAFAIFTGYLINAIYSVFRLKGITNIFIFFILVFLTVLSLHDDISSPTPDFLAITIPLFILTRVIEIAQQESEITLKTFIPVLILSVYILTIKLAALPLLLLVILLFYKHRYPAKKIMAILLMMALIILPWLIRNVVLTGWLVYPLPSVNLFSFDWQVPLVKVIYEKQAITGWARNAGNHALDFARMPLTGWFPIWWQQLTFGGKMLFAGASCLPPVIFLGQAIRKINIGYLKNGVIAIAYSGFLFWFFLAPDFRFGQAFIIISVISPLIVLPFCWKAFSKPVIGFTVIIIILLYIQVNNSKQYLDYAVKNISALTIKPRLMENIPSNLGFKTYQVGGVTIYVPAVGDRCFCHAIPCTPYMNKKMVLRGHTLAGGFKVLKN